VEPSALASRPRTKRSLSRRRTMSTYDLQIDALGKASRRAALLSVLCAAHRSSLSGVRFLPTEA
jgi:hypothetical protein